MTHFIKTTLLVILLCLINIVAYAQRERPSAFKQTQLKHKKVKEAYDSLWPVLQKELKAINVKPESFDIFLRAFKQEKNLEVWVKNKTDITYQLLKTYDICATSGTLGRKKKEGDGQIPEGFYEIDLFNPKSNYYLSMRVNYPNNSDRLLNEGNPGGAIMIHGDCVTIGCIPITDEKIKELYVLCVEAKARQNPIYVDIYPCHLTSINMKALEKTYKKEDVTFWHTLKIGYDYFEKNKWLPKVVVDKKGHYTFEE